MFQGTTYAVMDFGVFVCSTCSGVHRELSHKVKGVGMSNFSDKELELLQKNGNEVSPSMVYVFIECIQRFDGRV